MRHLTNTQQNISEEHMEKLIQTYLETLSGRLENLLLVMLIGKRACGKGTLAKILCHLLANYGQYHTISVSGIMDEHIKKFETDGIHDLGRRLHEQKAIRKAGGLMSDLPVTESTFGEIMLIGQIYDAGKLLLLLDGFPRTEGQGDAIYAVCQNALGLYSEIPDRVVYLRAAKRTSERAEEGLPPRDDDQPSAIREHLNNWPRTLEAIHAMQRAHCGSILPFDGTSPIRKQIKLCLRHFGFSETEIAKIMRPLDTNPDHEASKIVAKLEGPSHDRKVLAQQARIQLAQPRELQWVNFGGPVPSPTQLRA